MPRTWVRYVGEAEPFPCEHCRRHWSSNSGGEEDVTCWPQDAVEGCAETMWCVLQPHGDGQTAQNRLREMGFDMQFVIWLCFPRALFLQFLVFFGGIVFCAIFSGLVFGCAVGCEPRQSCLYYCMRTMIGSSMSAQAHMRDIYKHPCHV